MSGFAQILSNVCTYLRHRQGFQSSSQPQIQYSEPTPWATGGSWGDCSGCQQDLDDDGVVGGIDIGLLLVGWGICP